MRVYSYFSRSLLPPDAVDQELKNIVASSLRQNPPLGLTGMLIYLESHFIQLLEGEADNIKAIMGRIRADERHADVTDLVDEPLAQRQYPDWTMETFFLSNPTAVNVKTIEGLRDIYKGSFNFQPREFIFFMRELLNTLDDFKVVRSHAND